MAAPIYLYNGPEFGKRNEAVAAVKSALKKKYASVDEYVFYLVETPFAQAMTTLQDGSLFSDATCVEIRGCEAIKNKSDIQMITDWLEKNPSDSSTLILVSDETSVDAKLKKAVPASNQKQFWEMFESEKLPWIMNFFSKNGYSLDQDAAELILEMVENNTEAMRNECSRFFIVFPQGSTITAENVEQILEHNREETPFTLFNKMTDVSKQPAERLESALSVLQKLRLSKENNSVMLLAGLTSCFRKLQTWHKVMAENPYADDFTLKTNGFGAKMMQKQYRNAAKLWSAGQTAAVLALISSTDMQIRNGGTLLEDVMLQKALYEIILKKGGSSATWEVEKD